MSDDEYAAKVAEIFQSLIDHGYQCDESGFWFPGPDWQPDSYVDKVKRRFGDNLVWYDRSQDSQGDLDGRSGEGE